MDWIYAGFHDATLASADHVGNTIHLSVADIDPAAPGLTATIRISGVSSITENGSSIPLFRMKLEDEELLTVKYRNAGDVLEAVLVIQWNAFTPPRLHLVEVYEILCTDFDVSLSHREPA